MITALKKFVRLIFFPSLYFSGFIICVYTVFKEAIWGFLLLVALIPQPNIWHKFYGLPLGKDFLDLLFIAIFLGIFVQGKKIPSTSNSFTIGLFVLLSYISLWTSALKFDLPLPLTTENSQLFQWKNFAQMILFYYATLAVVTNEKRQKTVFFVITCVFLFISVRNFRNFSASSSFSYDKRVGGPFEFVNLGATHYGAFISHFMSSFLGMSFFEKELRKKIVYLATFCMCLHPLFYSYSRGAYLGAIIALVFLGVVKKKSILVVMLVGALCWHVVLPPSVVDRISGTRTASGELEGSASTRFKLWQQSAKIISENPIMGAGWESFALSIPVSERIGGLTDTHNYYLKTLCDRGVIGLLLLALVLVKAFFSGLKLFRIGTSQFQKGLGLCFSSIVLAVFVTNLFGDRFTYFVMGSYFWIIWGVVDRGLILSKTQ